MTAKKQRTAGELEIPLALLTITACRQNWKVVACHNAGPSNGQPVVGFSRTAVAAYAQGRTFYPLSLA